MDTVHELLVDQLQDLYDAEQQLLTALPKMEEAASDDTLKVSFEEHLEETRDHVSRLEESFSILEVPVSRKTCMGMQGLIQEAEENLQEAVGAIRDLAIVAQASRIEHYEIAGYRMAIDLADRLDLDDVGDLLERTLDEEEHAAGIMLSYSEESMMDKLGAMVRGEART